MPRDRDCTNFTSQSSKLATSVPSFTTQSLDWLASPFPGAASLSPISSTVDLPTEEMPSFSPAFSSSSSVSDSLSGDSLASDMSSDEMSMDENLATQNTPLFSVYDDKPTDDMKNCTLPFPRFSSQWYKKQWQDTQRNSIRERVRYSNPHQKDETGVMVWVNRAQVTGSLESNITSLYSQISCGTNTLHLKAVYEVGKYILSCGPLVATQDAAKLYMDVKHSKSRKQSGDLYEILSKHLNIVQVYLYSKGYLLHNSGSNIETLLKTITESVNKEAIVKERVSERLQDIFQGCLHYIDTPRDKEVLKGIFAELTSVRFTAKLSGVQSRLAVTTAKNQLKPSLEKNNNLCKTSQTVRSDLTTEQQHRLTRRVIAARKVKEIRIIAAGRGRKLKSQEFPDLAALMECVFGEYDIAQGGGGLEAHPRLTTDVLYRASDSATTMKEARKILLSLAPRGLSISLSSCYNERH